MIFDARPLRDLAAARGRPSGPDRSAAVRDAGEALAEHLRDGSGVDGLERLDLGTLALAPRDVLAGWTSPLALALLRRQAWLLRVGGVRVLVDPCTADDFVSSPYGERVIQRHPMRARAIRAVPLEAALARAGTRPEEIGLVILTHLRFASIPRLLSALPRARIVVGEREWAAVRAPSAWERPFLDRTAPEKNDRVVLAPGDAMLEGGIALVACPGLTEGTVSVAVSVGRRVRVFSAHGLTSDAWTPYESSLSGLRESVRLRDVEVVPRGDAASAALATESMILERSIADREGAFSSIDTWATLLPPAAFLRR